MQRDVVKSSIAQDSIPVQKFFDTIESPEVSGGTTDLGGCGKPALHCRALQFKVHPSSRDLQEWCKKQQTWCRDAVPMQDPPEERPGDGPAVFVEPLSLLNRVEEASLYHRTDREWGFFQVLSSRNYIDVDGKGHVVKDAHNYKVNRLAEVLENIRPDRNTWISQAEFYKPNRCLVNVVFLNCNFLDIDYHAVPELKGLDPREVARMIYLACAQNGLPLPNVVVFSGRGLQVKWIYAPSIPAKALPRWRAVQKELCRLFLNFGADPKALDASRVLRVVDTINEKSKRVVKVIAKLDKPYTFDDIARAVLPFTQAEVWEFNKRIAEENAERRRRLEERLKARGDRQVRTLPNGLRAFDKSKFNWDRLGDLRTLAKIRGGVGEGQRDEFLFLSACFLAWSIEPPFLYSELYQLAGEYAPSWSRGQIHSDMGAAYRRAVDAMAGKTTMYKGKPVDPRYKFRNQTLIERLRIEPDEERQLDTIISEGEAKRRDAERKAKCRAAQGRQSRDEYLRKSEETRQRARTLRSQGKTYDEIATDLGIRVNHVARLLK